MNKENLKDDLIKLDYHINEIIDNLICAGRDEEFKEDIEQIEMFFSYWRTYIK